MKSKFGLLLSLLALFSCQQYSNSNSRDENNLDVDSIIVTTQLKKDLIETIKNDRVPNIEDSTWVFQNLKNNPYPYNTKLSNGYYLKHKVFKDPEGNQYVQSLTLMNAEKTIKEFGYSSYGLPYKNIGYVGADFNKSFVMVYSFGSGNPHIFELINKESGKKLRSGTWVGVNEFEQILLYIENEHDKDERLIIYDIKNNNEIISTGFEMSKCVEHLIGGLRNCVQIDTVTTNEIVLKIDTDEERIIKKYKR